MSRECLVWSRQGSGLRFIERVEMFRFWINGQRLRLVVVGLVVLTAAIVTACGSSDDGGSASTGAAVQPTATATVASPPEATATEIPAPSESKQADPTATAVVVATQKSVATSTPAATVMAAATAEVADQFDKTRFVDISGIIDPTNFGWPRSIETSEGVITLDSPPQKIHSLSLGHSEILAALIDFDRLTAVYSFFVDEEQSNIAKLSADHKMIGFDPEEVIALEPDVIIASRFTNADTVALLKSAGIPVARASLESTALGNIPNILLMGYMFGAEARAIELADEIEARMQFISDVLVSDAKPRVLSVSKWTSAFAAGSGTTEGGIIEQAGGINAAADSGIEGHQQVSIESIAAISPDVIIVPQPLDSANVFIEELTSSPALAEIPAVKNGAIYYVPPRYHTTLSHWNVRGIERLATLLYPSLFSGVIFEDFANYGE